ncbi:hypothetical protein B0H14DRAFT_3445953 [Mycena olivaceomarginata]|nr:hypothetical protein B0H14DRAFT_3445953 [Mycena olivaceomarginata]
MTSPLCCSPPFHPDPGTTKETARAFYLVTGPAAAENRGVYTSWASAQRVSENIPRGGATNFATWDQCLPVWHSCCDAGDHDHPTPFIACMGQVAAPSPSPKPPTTTQMGCRVGQTGAVGGAVPCSRTQATSAIAGMAKSPSSIPAPRTPHLPFGHVWDSNPTPCFLTPLPSAPSTNILPRLLLFAMQSRGAAPCTAY